MNADMTEFNTSDWEERLMETGMIGNVFGGIQMDITATHRKLKNGTLIDAHLCDHNCVQISEDEKSTGGNYTCPAAIGLNRGIIGTNLAPSSYIIEGVRHTADAIESSKEFFLDSQFFDSYRREYNIPYEVGEAIKGRLKKGNIEVNLFGGNPEMHPKVGEIIRELKESGYVINLTTTGRRFMTSPRFHEEILSNPPNLIGLSADDFGSGEQISSMANLSLEEIKDAWKKVPKGYGQRQKLLESIYTAKLSQEDPKFPKVLFNMVVHTGNLPIIDEILTVLHEKFPRVILNPYPAQSSFLYKPSLYNTHHVEMLQDFVDKMIKAQVSEECKWPLVPRLHYWLLLKSAFETFSERKISDALSGYGVWKCYAKSGAGRYVQVGISPEPTNGRYKIAGGHLGCFWNDRTVTDKERQIWDMSKEEIEHYITRGIVDLANTSEKPCPGCIMPRLVFDVISLEQGMNNQLWPSYRKLREQYIGY